MKITVEQLDRYLAGRARHTLAVGIGYHSLVGDRHDFCVFATFICLIFFLIRQLLRR